jgi:hypothetical protein
METNYSTDAKDTHEIKGFSGAKELYYILLKVLISKGVKMSEFHDKTKINKVSHYRYIRGSERTGSVIPKFAILMKFADFLGYEIVLLKKK